MFFIGVIDFAHALVVGGFRRGKLGVNGAEVVEWDDFGVVYRDGEGKRADEVEGHGGVFLGFGQLGEVVLVLDGDCLS